MWRTFINDGSMARKAQSDWLFLQNMDYICLRGTKIHWKGQKTLNPTQKNCFSQASQPLSQFDLKCCSNKSGQTKFGLKCCSNKSGQIDFGLKRCNISGQIDFGLKCCSNISGQTDLSWYVAATFQAKLSLSWYVAATFWEFWETNRVFSGFTQFFVQYFASWQSLWYIRTNWVWL